MLRGERQTGEVHMRRDVLVAHFGQRVGVGPMPPVAHQCAHVALDMVILSLGKPVVQKKGRPLDQPIGERGHERLGHRVDLGQIVVATGDLQRWPQVARPVFPGQSRDSAAGVDANAAFTPPARPSRQQLDGHRVENFIADHDPAHRHRQLAGPAHLAGVLPEGLALALLQGARQVDDGVGLQPVTDRFQQLLCQCAASGAEFPQLRSLADLQCLLQLARNRTPEKRRHFRRGRKVAAPPVRPDRHHAELRTAVGVVAKAGRVQREFHEAVESDPAPAVGHNPAHMGLEAAR